MRICDFSLARRQTQDAALTKYMVTRWYRPPEILLCKQQYGCAVDVWSAGCIFAELIMPPSPQRRGLFPGVTYKDQTDKIIEVRKPPIHAARWSPRYLHRSLPLAVCLKLVVRCLDRRTRKT